MPNGLKIVLVIFFILSILLGAKYAHMNNLNIINIDNSKKYTTVLSTIK